VLFTIAPWRSVTWTPPSDWNAARQQVTDQVNAWVRSQAAPRVAVCDVWTALNDGDGRLLSTYDSGDGIHLTQAGYDLVAGLTVVADPPRR
jgi:lysophospholipase L1-like esterase